MPSLIDAREAFALIKRFMDEQTDRDVSAMLSGETPDMVDGLLCQAQLCVLGWFMGGTFNDPEHEENASAFKQTLDRLRKRYRSTEVDQ